MWKNKINSMAYSNDDNTQINTAIHTDSVHCGNLKCTALLVGGGRCQSPYTHKGYLCYEHYIGHGIGSFQERDTDAITRYNSGIHSGHDVVKCTYHPSMISPFK